MDYSGSDGWNQPLNLLKSPDGYVVYLCPDFCFFSAGHLYCSNLAGDQRRDSLYQSLFFAPKFFLGHFGPIQNSTCYHDCALYAFYLLNSGFERIHDAICDERLKSRPGGAPPAATFAVSHGHGYDLSRFGLILFGATAMLSAGGDKFDGWG